MARGFTATKYLYVTLGTGLSLPFCLMCKSYRSRAAEMMVCLTHPSLDDHHCIKNEAKSPYRMFAQSWDESLTLARNAVSTTYQNANTWYTVGGNFNDNTSRQIFVNGVLEDTDNTLSAAAVSGLTVLGIGVRYIATPTDQWVGRIGEAGIWNVGLAEEYHEAFASGIPIPKIVPEYLVHWFSLFGDRIYDPWGNETLTEVGPPTDAPHPRMVSYPPSRGVQLFRRVSLDGIGHRGEPVRVAG